MTNATSTPLLAHLALLALLGITPASAQQPPAFGERVDVNVVNVETWVTDRRGDPVFGLRSSDFEVFEDGQPVTISNFYSATPEGRAGDSFLPMVADRDRNFPARDAESRTPVRALKPLEQRLNLLIYVDQFNLSPRNRDRVLDQLGSFLLDRTARGDTIMLVSYSNRSIKVVEAFTSDRRTLFDGLHKLRMAATHRQADDALRRQKMRIMEEYVREGDLNSAYDVLRLHVEAARHDLRHSVQALSTVIRSLAGLPGRRAVLYVSDGLPSRPGEEMYQYLSDLAPLSDLNDRGANGRIIDPSIEALNQDESHVIKAMTREANAHQVTLYTLDARGPGGDASYTSDQRGLPSTAAGTTGLDAIRSFNLQEPLIEMAERTGGASILNTTNFEQAFGDISEDLESFYSLGYASLSGGDGEYHSIEVRAKNPAYKVRHRTGYLDKPAKERVADRTLSSLLLGVEKNPLGVQIAFGAAEKSGRKEYLLPVLVRVPIKNLTLLPGPNTQDGSLKIFVAVQDEEGRVSDLSELSSPVSIPTAMLAEALTKDTGQMNRVKVRPGLLTFAIGVWDEVSGADSVVQKQVRVGGG